MSRDITDFVQRAALEYALEDFDDAFGDLSERLDGIAHEAAAEALEFWRAEAGRMLNTTRKRYQDTLYIYEDFSGEEGVVIGMTETDPLVLNIEQGAESYDLKPGLLAGRTVRVIPIGPPRSMAIVSAGMGADKWIHPGFEGLDLVGETDKQLDEVIVPKHLNKLFDAL